MLNVKPGLYTLSHGEDDIGRSNLEAGDPAEHSVSGVFNNLGGAKALAGWIKSVGGREEDGAVYVALDDGFSLRTEQGDAIRFDQGTLIAVPEQDETFIEISGVPPEDYRSHFTGHLEALSGDQQ